MRVTKWLLAVTLAAGLVGAGAFGLAPRASADNGPHGGYVPDTGACAGCHRAHTAAGPLLLKEASVTELCFSCHDGTEAPATNVKYGTSTGGARLAGGGFTQAWRGTPTDTGVDWNRCPNLTNPTDPACDGIEVAVHGVDTEATAWGGASSGMGVLGTLECTSCHNPHGSSNFRILRDSDNGFPHTDGQCGGTPGCAAKAHRWVSGNEELLDWVDNQVVPVPASAEFDYSPDDAAYYSGFVQMGSGGPPVPTLGMGAFCATCHKQYLTKSGSYSHPSTDPDYYVYPGTQALTEAEGAGVARYRHVVLSTHGTPDTQNPLRRGALGTIATGEGGGAPTNCADGEDNDLDGDIDLADSDCAVTYGDPATYTARTCLTCHFAHGSAAANSLYGGDVAPTNDNALLYYDNRGVCRSCHFGD